MDTNFGQYSKRKGTPPQEYTDWKANPNDQTYQSMMKYLDPTIQSGIKSYAQGDKSLQVRANILATQAVHGWDPSKGAAIKTHVFNNLKGLQRYRNKRSAVVHIPENVRTDAVKVKRYIKNFESERGYEPSDAEVSDALSMSLKRIQKSKRGELPVSQYVDERGDATMSQARDPYSIWQDYVYHDLSPTNRKIYEWTTGYGGNKQLSRTEIAKRLKISTAAVSMRVSTIQKRLSEVIDS
jgi:DNA-directed RNA polymerase specialized sigma subunit